jgi:benzoyl-CoA reductase/2-hydroxyglutaryl-CoA dehydratase subunit BcrC/BadD/HgdB
MERIDEILSELKSVADRPAAALEKLIKAGRKAVGCMPMYCPEELIYAAGMLPFAVWGADLAVTEAARYFPSFICSIMQTSLELGLSGKLDGLSGMIIPALCDSMKCMGQNWKAGVKTVPYIPLFHPQNRGTKAGIDFLVSEYRKVLGQLEEIAGHSASDEDIERAISIYNAQRLAMRRFGAVSARYPQIITPLRRCAVIKSAGFLDAALHTAIVSELCYELEKLPEQPWTGKKIVTTGILADVPAILSILEDNQIAIAADEVAAESRRFRTLTPDGGPALERLARRIALHEGCSVLFDPYKKRGGMILDMVRESSADGVIVLMTKFCDPEEFDYAIMKKQFETAGVPHIAIEVDRQTHMYEQARTAIETFASVI